ncbi:fas-binding factor 1 [Musca domestica]|uniref:Fas-binding factor 1 n=1 Tax=Musca domestica TaxID=7370 RepID=A0A9J7DC40_MUSDO|nr:fas-binding factor 1 [Musca domestica]XP_058977081.1 fas-binding factor 1 [Musca domestica]
MDLSDNGLDDFDNFFGAKKTKQPTSKISDPMEDLFGIDDGKDSRVPAPRKTVTKSLGVKSLLADKKDGDNDDDDDDLGFDPKKPKGGLNKSQNLFDDLLTPLETKRPQTAGPSSKPPTISRQSTDTTTDTSNILQTQTRPKTSAGRRSSNLQNPDPLGLFSKDRETNVPSSSGRSTPKAKKKGNTADWLGLNVETEPESTQKTAIRPETPKSNIPPASRTQDTAEILQVPDVREEHYEDPPEETLNTQRHSAPAPKDDANNQEPQDIMILDSTAHNIRLMNTMNLEAKQSFTALKYQEQQLLMAAQMKQQEKVLMEMQQRQNTLLHQQEKQFQTLLQQQMQRHQQLEDLIKQQQNRINTHLHLLMSQPPAVEASMGDWDEGNPNSQESYKREPKVKESEDGDHREREKQHEMDVIQLEADNKRLELENLRLEELVANTKNNYEREIEILEKTYKKQIEVLEEHLSNLEKRLKSEIEELQKHFQKKIDTLEEEKTQLKTNYTEEIQNLKQDHEDELRKLKKNQEEDLEMLKEEHRRMLDNIRQAKMLEFAAVQENVSYLECLRVASSNLSDLTGGLSELKENMQNKIDQLHLEREKKLELRERKLEDAEKRLKIHEESNEAEKNRLMELVSTLELQMTKMSKESAEENWQLRQKLASLDAEKAAFAKEREFFREQMLRDEERIKDLKEFQLLETQRLQSQIQEERAQLQVEKSKFDLEKRLHANTNTQKERQEIEAAMQVTQDASRKADVERERYYKMQRHLEQQKRDLADKEHALSVKEEELQQELMSFRMAERVAQETQQKAKMAEQFYHNKIQMLQQRTQEIAEKESNLSQERLLLAQDRIALHALKTKLSQQTKCSLCQLSQQNKDITENLNRNISLVYDKPLEEFQLPMNRQNHSVNMDFMGQSNAVERLLDANIADSLRKMTSSGNMAGWEMLLLDDDHKKMVQSSNQVGNSNRNEDEYGGKRN